MTESLNFFPLISALVLGFILGLVPALLLIRSRLDAARQTGRQELATTQATLEERLVGRETRLQEVEALLRIREQKLEEMALAQTLLERDKARLAAELQEQSKSADEKLHVLNEAKNELQRQFENLANQIFEAKTKSFAEQSQAKLDSILTPFKDKISEFEKKVHEVYTSEGKERHSLIREVQKLQELNQKLGEDAENLTKALKGDTKSQGTWGEIILERILEESGLRKGIEYESQGGFRDADGKLMKPDVVVHLPEDKDIVIDSKVSLVAYDRYVRAEDDAMRHQAIKEHLISIHGHLKNLESKRYEELPGLKSLDFVLMFIPVESAFMLAIEKDSEIFRKAFDKNIMIVSPSTLLVTLRTIQNIWRYEYQNKNALEIAERAGGLYDKFVGFVSDLERIGDQIENARKAYDGAHNKLISGRGNLVSRAQSLIELGVKSRKQLPATVRESSETSALAMTHDDQASEDESP